MELRTLGSEIIKQIFIQLLALSFLLTPAMAEKIRVEVGRDSVQLRSMDQEFLRSIGTLPKGTVLEIDSDNFNSPQIIQYMTRNGLKTPKHGFVRGVKVISIPGADRDPALARRIQELNAKSTELYVARSMMKVMEKEADGDVVVSTKSDTPVLTAEEKPAETAVAEEPAPAPATGLGVDDTSAVVADALGEGLTSDDSAPIATDAAAARKREIEEKVKREGMASLTKEELDIILPLAPLPGADANLEAAKAAAVTAAQEGPAFERAGRGGGLPEVAAPVEAQATSDNWAENLIASISQGNSEVVKMNPTNECSSGECAGMLSPDDVNTPEIAPIPIPRVRPENLVRVTPEQEIEEDFDEVADEANGDIDNAVIRKILAYRGRNGERVPAGALANAIKFMKANSGRIPRQDVITIANMTDKSDRERLFVINLKTGKVEGFWTSHGQGSGVERLTSWGSGNGSHKTPQGFLVTGAAIPKGDCGKSTCMWLDGLERRNANARDREIIFHAANYVDGNLRDGNLGRSHGCPAANPRDASRIRDLTKNGSLWYHYDPSERLVRDPQTYLASL